MDDEAGDGTAVGDAAKISTLSADERRRIAAEVRFREELVRELAREKPPQPDKRGFSLGEVLNSPFVLTIVGGMLLAMIGAVLQHHYSSIEDDRAYVRTVREKKYEMLRSFSGDLDLQIRCMAWLNNNLRSIEGRDATGKLTDSGYSQQKLRGYQDILQLYLKTPQASAYADQINALFTTDAVHRKMSEFLAAQAAAVEGAGRMIATSKPSDDVEAKTYAMVTNTITKPRLELFIAMQEEIKHTTAESR